MKALFLVVTMTGTAEMLAEDIIEALGGEHEFSLQLAENVEAEALQSVQDLVVISSTYGKGEVPDPGRKLFQALQANPEQLAHLRYAVISLGDSVYHETFAQGGKHWRTLLQGAGAREMHPPLLLDASADTDATAIAV